jgi:hypothetical protein
MPATSQEPSRSRITPQEETIRQLFPLPVVPFELMMLLDDCPAFPMTFCVELVFRGRLEREVLQRAVDDAVARHPLLRARIEWTQRFPVWVLGDEVDTSIRWLSNEELLEGDAFHSLDLQRECGLRVLAAGDESRSSLWMHFHHACCDGQGARRFAVDVLTGYAREISKRDQPPWDRLDYSLLLRRHDFTGGSTGAGQATTTLWQKIRDAFHFHVLTPQPLANVATCKNPSPNDDRTRRIFKHTLERSETERIERRCQEQEVNLNDVALAFLFATLADWNRRHGRAADSQRLRILMPTDLRSSSHRRMPAANHMSFAFLARSVGQCLDWDSLVTGVQNESRYFHQVRIGHDFLGGIALAGQVPGLLKLLLNLPRCMATAILTNLGDPTRRFRRRFPVRDCLPVIGNVELERIFGTPPLRARMHAGFGLCVCSQQLQVSMIANPQIVGNRAEELMQSYLQHWRDWQ